MEARYEKPVLNRLKTARGHLDAVVRMVEDDSYCPDVMKQLSAVQGLLEGASRLVLRNHLETCVAAAMREGRTGDIVEELMDALRYDRIATGPDRVPEATSATAQPATRTRDRRSSPQRGAADRRSSTKTEGA